jgi:four helix bundle protein
MAKRIEALPIYSKVNEFWSAVNAILDLPTVRRDSDLHDEMSRANESIGSNMVEGFEQGTDRAFANYLCYSKGSISEVLKRLRKAFYKRYITQKDLNARLDQGEELKKMLGGFIKYLRRSDWVDRGSHGYPAGITAAERPLSPRANKRKTDRSSRSDVDKRKTIGRMAD